MGRAVLGLTKVAFIERWPLWTGFMLFSYSSIFLIQFSLYDPGVDGFYYKIL